MSQTQVTTPFFAPPAALSPAQALERLRKGNQRFATGQSEHPHRDTRRLAQAGTVNQRGHAFATVISCSDSRVPVELLFDAGVMDIFVVRIAGNICTSDVIASIEYGLTQVCTPVLVLLGHTDCGAVTAATRRFQGRAMVAPEGHIAPLLDRIEPAVQRAETLFPKLKTDDLIPHAVEENVWWNFEILLRHSSIVRKRLAGGAVKAVPAVYAIATGCVRWLQEERMNKLLQEGHAE